MSLHPELVATASQPLARVEECSSAISFFALDGIDKALKASDWSVSREVHILSNIAQHDPHPEIQMAAITMLRKHMREALVMSGQISSMTLERSIKEGDTQLVQAFQSFSLNPLGRPTNTEAMLDMAAKTTKVIEAKVLQGDENVQDEVEAETSPEVAGSIPDEPRDLGGGGLAETSRKAARIAREREYQSAVEEDNGGAAADSGEEDG